MSGPPGAGKTTFALSLIKAMMSSVVAKSVAPDGSQVRGPKPILYYISSEVSGDQLKENYKDFGWFEGPDEPQIFRFRMDSQKPDETNFYAIAPSLEVDRPVPSPEELINGIFNRISHTLLPSEAPTEDAKIYVIIDSVTALLKGCSTPGEERRQTHEILRRLQDRFGRDETKCSNLAFTVLLAEHDHRSHEFGSNTSPALSTLHSVEDYLADVVFRLYVRNLPLGRRSRAIEVVKSQGVNMTLGEHTWQIVTKANYKEILRQPDFQKEVKRACIYESNQSSGDNPVQSSGIDEANWGGIIVFPRQRQSLGLDHELPAAKENEGAGTIGLEHLHVPRGSVTLIAGPMGCGKTTLCEQFLSAGGVDPKEKHKRVLISFGIPRDQQKAEDSFETMVFTQSQFDLNILIAHIDWVINELQCERLAFDGLAEWITLFDKSHAVRAIEAVIVAVKRHYKKTTDQLPPAVFMTYELPFEHEPLGPVPLGAAADNLIVIRKVPINDEPRNVIYAIKRAGVGALSASDAATTDKDADDAITDKHPGELVWRNSKYEVDSTSLEAFTGLLSSARRVEPARVLVQLFAENSAEYHFNMRMAEKLTDQYAKRLNLTFTRFTLSELGSTLETAFGAGRPGETFNLAVHSVDEWWLRAKKTNERFLRDLRRTKGTAKGPNYRDFWWFEIEKSLDVFEEEADKPDKLHSRWRAVPGYLDYGMFCINLDAMTRRERDRLESLAMHSTKQTSDPQSSHQVGTIPEDATLTRQRRKWKLLLTEVPRVWVNVRDNWFDIDGGPAQTVLHYALEMTGQSGKLNIERKPVFAFDSSTRETCSCMFFELAWAFGAKESFLADGNDKSGRHCARVAMMFLQFMVLEGLVPARSSAHTANHNDAPILFSRQWYSTVRKYEDVREKGASRQSHGVEGAIAHSQLFAIPFMPIGISDPQGAADNLLDDIAVRQLNWLRRAGSCFQNDKLGASPASRLRVIKELSEDILATTDTKQKLKNSLSAYSISREWLLEMANMDSGLPDSDVWNADLDDLTELSAWAALRLQLLFGRYTSPPSTVVSATCRSPLRAALYEARWVRHSLPDLNFAFGGTDKASPSIESWAPELVFQTGYVCSGSWMFGIDKHSRSSDIQSRILAELTSLESAELRASTGAGLPARKDFFYLHGEKAVTGMPYLQWRELLRYGGSRCRRRDRVLVDYASVANLPDGQKKGTRNAIEDPSEIYETIHRQMLNCLRIADLHRQMYARGGEGQRTAIAAATKQATLAIDAIFESATKASPSR